METLLTTSSSRCFHNCARQYKYRYIDCYKQADTPSYFAYGTSIHALLSQHYLNEMDTEAFESAQAYVSKEEWTRMWALDSAYRKHYANEPYRALEGEKEFTIDELGYKLAGKVDLIVEDEEKNVWLMEHKTASAMPDEKSIKHDPQVLNYLLAHPEVKGLIYNVLVKPRHKQKKDETEIDFQTRIEEELLSSSDKYFKRIVVLRDEATMRLAQHRNDEVATSIAFAKERNFWPQNPYACHKFGQTCEFYDVCTNRTTLEESDKIKRSDKIHLELA